MSRKIISNLTAKSDHPWIQSTRFEPQSQAQVLQMVLDRVKEATRFRTKHGGKKVKVVFDLDSTIFDVKPRSMRILKEFALMKGVELNPKFAEWSLNLFSHRLLYTLEESARANEFPGTEQEAKSYMREAFKYWLDRFFHHRYVTMDHPTPGAVDFVSQVVDLGAHAVYLTGRDWPGMGKGTQTMLEFSGFPVDPRVTELIMKPNSGLDDSEFKDDALRDLRIHAEAVALIDNEPANFHVFEKNFPDAALVFYHSNCSTKDAKPVKKIYKIENFLLD